MKSGILGTLVLLMTLVSNPESLSSAINSNETKGNYLNRITDMCKGNRAFAGAILGGIMIMIVGFATLILGNYIVFAIYQALPTLNNANYNTTRDAIIAYANTVMPLFGLALMVLGFAIILLTLRTSMQTESR